MNLAWTPVISANVTAQRVSKRKKSTGGAFDTTGFTPANNLGLGVSSATTTVLDNTVYEFKVENICNTGGPTLNNNGIREQIKFSCILPQLTRSKVSINANIPLLGTDVTKVGYVLKKASDSSTVESAVVVRDNDNAPYSFTGLTSGTSYYLTVVLYAVVNGVEVLSSDAAYLNAVCGGNVTGYQIATSISTIPCQAYINSTSLPATGVAYIDCISGQSYGGQTINPGVIVCTRTGDFAPGSFADSFTPTTVDYCPAFAAG